jgi:MarR family 2-MHQ and catechol resistance regulon transcriptional repressor
MTTSRYGRKDDLALSTWVKLARSFSVFNRKTAEHIRSFGLTQAQFGVLEVLGHKGPMTPGELCNKQLVSGGNVTVVVDHLERDGFVERRRSRTDRRSVVVHLTPAGRNLFERIFPLHAQFVGSLASVLSGREQKELGDLLKKLGTTLAAK